MSKIIASAAIRGAHSIVDKAEDKLRKAIDEKGPNEVVEFPNTGYYLPVIYGFTGMKVEKLSDIERVIKLARELLPDVPAEKLWLPYLGNVLDAGAAALFGSEIIEGLKYVIGPNPVDGFWLGAADDVIMRQRGVEFVDGSAPGFAAVTGAAPTNEIAVQLARDMKEKSLYIFIAGRTNGKSFAEQLAEEGIELGWDTRLVPFGPDIYGHIYSLGFATRAAMAFGGVTPGDFKNILQYNKDRVFAFVVALDEVEDEKYAAAAGAINYGFPTIADTNIPQILATGVCTYEHVVSNVPHDSIIAKAIEVRGLKIVVKEIPIPVAYGPAFDGERVRKEDLQVEMGGTKSPVFEWVRMAESPDEVEDGKIEVVGTDIDEVDPGSKLALGIDVKVYGRKMQSDFEPILERQIHHMINGAEGLQHIGQRDIIWLRIHKNAVDKGFRLSHIGSIVHALFHSDYNSIVDKVQIKLYTDEAKVLERRDTARQVYHTRDERIAGLTDDAVDTFYSCTLCQSFAPTHLCIITPERPGLCGAYNWLDGKAAFEIDPTGPNQPVKKGDLIDETQGQWAGVNEFVYKGSQQTLEKFSAYSMINDPMTSCGCFECISALLPLANGIMTVNRDFPEMTPCGMKFSTLAGSVGGGLQTPGFIGHSKFYVGSRKFISADGGLKRLVWMPKEMKEELRPMLEQRGKEIGIPNFIDMIATEEDARTEEEVLAFLESAGHPALSMEPMI